MLIIPVGQASAQGAGTIVGATVCTASSVTTITLTTPASDSIVTDSNVPLAGDATQANQVEVYVDNVLDSVIQLTIGQTSFNGSVQLSSGTHTIKAVAISSCTGNGDKSVTSIVTYLPPTETSPSNGGTVETGVTDNHPQGGVQISGSSDQISSGTNNTPLIPRALSMPFEELKNWLDIGTQDTSSTKQSLSVWRAVVLAAGFYLALLGVAGTVLSMMAGVPIVTTMLPGPSKSVRIKRLALGFRLLGIMLVLGALFL